MRSHHATDAAAIVGNPTKTYDGTAAATLTPANFQLTGLLAGESLSITQLTGAYNSPDTKATTVSASLSPGNYAAGAGTSVLDYVLPTRVSGPGAIGAAALTASIIGDPTKTFDGTATATLTPANFQLTGLVVGQSFTVTQTTGAYDSQHTNAATVGANLSASNFTAGLGTLISDYTLPTSASGAGTILAAPLTVSIVGDPTKPYDGTTAAALSPANFQVNGLAPGDALTITQSAGTYDSADVFAAKVSALLSADDYTPAPGVQATDYVLPTSASGAGTITQASQSLPYSTV